MAKLDFKKIGMRAAYVGAGAVASKYASKMITKVAGDKIPPFVNPLVRLAVGGYLTTQKGPMMQNMGDGIMAQSAVDLVNAFTNNALGAADSVLGIGEDSDYTVEGMYDGGMYGDDEMQGADNSVI